jgi:hypothetical protein
MVLNKGFWACDQAKNEYEGLPDTIDKNSGIIYFDFYAN